MSKGPSVIQYVPGDRVTAPVTVNPPEICIPGVVGDRVHVPLVNKLPAITQLPLYVVPVFVQVPVVGMPLVRKAWVTLLAYGSAMLGAPIKGREVSANSGGGAAGLIGSPMKETSPRVTRVAAVMEPVLL